MHPKFLGAREKREQGGYLTIPPLFMQFFFQWYSPQSDRKGMNVRPPPLQA